MNSGEGASQAKFRDILARVRAIISKGLRALRLLVNGLYWLFVILLLASVAWLVLSEVVSLGQDWRHDYQARKVVRSILNDPDSAQFRNQRTDRARRASCGEFNAKNSYGGYPGYSRFVVVLSDRQVFLEGQDGFDEHWSSFCASKQKGK